MRSASERTTFVLVAIVMLAGFVGIVFLLWDHLGLLHDEPPSVERVANEERSPVHPGQLASAPGNPVETRTEPAHGEGLHVALAVAGDPTPDGASEDPDDGEAIAQDEGTVVFGRVRAPDGSIPEGIVLRLRREYVGLSWFLGDEPVVGVGGAFRLTELEPGHYALFARAPGWAWSSLSFEPAEGARTGPVELVLKRGGAIHGRVVDAATKRPIAGARIVTVSELAGFEADGEDGAGRGATSGEEGHFELSGVPAGSTAIDVTHLSASSRRITGLEVADEEVTDAGDIALVQAGRIEGLVVEVSGAPVDGARIELGVISCAEGVGLDDLGALEAESQEILSDANGRFGISGLPPGRFRLKAYARVVGDGSQGVRMPTVAEVQVACGVLATVTIVVGAGARLDGRVVVDGEGVAGLTVDIMDFYESGIVGDIEALNMASETTGAEGRFAVYDLEPGRYILTFRPWHDRMIVIRRILDVPAGIPVVEALVEPPFGSLDVRVFQHGGGPAAGAQVVLEFEGADHAYRYRFDKNLGIVADAEGLARLTHLLAGRYAVRAGHEGRVLSAPVHVEVLPDHANGPIVLKLGFGGAMSGRVVHRDGVPLENAMVAVYREPLMNFMEIAIPLLRTKADGTWTAEGLPGESFRLLFQAVGMAEHRVGPITVPESGTVEIGEVVLEPGGGVRVAVRNAEGLLVAGIELLMWPASDAATVQSRSTPSFDALRRSATDTTGFATWQDLAAGDWDLYRIDAPWPPPVLARVPIAVGEVTEVTVSLGSE